MKLQVIYVEILNKKTKEIERIPMNDFFNHKSSTYQGVEIKPETITQSFNMLRDMVQGQIFQTIDHCVRIEGLKNYAWEWLPLGDMR